MAQSLTQTLTPTLIRTLVGFAVYLEHRKFLLGRVREGGTDHLGVGLTKRSALALVELALSSASALALGVGSGFIVALSLASGSRLGR